MDRIIYKTPAEIDFTTMDYTKGLGADSIDPAQPYVWNSSAPALQVFNPSLIGSPPTVAKTWYQGGIEETPYFIDSVITSLDKRTLSASVKIFVRQYNLVDGIIYKEPVQNADYKMPWWERLDAGDTVVSSSWSSSSPDVQINTGMSGINTPPKSTRVWFSGGVINVSYIITNRIVTASGRTLEQSFKLFILKNIIAPKQYPV